MKHSFIHGLLRPSICFLMTLCFPVLLYAQYDGTVPKVNAATPNAAALFKMEGRPPGSFTGTTPIGISLYTVNAGSLQVPVSMSYSNGGIRVEEVASWAGLGWNLSAGGRITRVMNGTADDDPSRGMLFTSPKPSAFPGSGGLVSHAAFVLNGSMDVEPDMFYFNFNGISGKFFFDENGNVKLVSQDAIKIEYTPNTGNIASWIITDTKGNKYYFGKDKNNTVSARELTFIDYVGSGSLPAPTPAYYSSWHLMEIRDMNEQNVIKFHYTQHTTNFTTLAGSSLALSAVVGIDCTPEETYSQEMFTVNRTEEFYLNKIEGGMDSLIFHSSNNRKDFSGGRRLDSLTFYARNNQLVKRHHFNYGYFTTPGAPSDVINDTYYKRLKLIKLSEFGLAANDSLTHTFDYVETVNLPSRLERSIDYWGYYNGAPNSTLIPNGVYRDGSNTYFMSTGGERRVNPTYSIANTLKKITFPTGGSREFDYESNQALLDYSNTQINPDASQYLNKDFNITTFSYPSSPYIPTATRNFTISGDDGVTLFKWNLTASDCPSNEFDVKLIKVGSSTVPDYDVTSWHGEYSGQYTLNNGEYRIEIYQGVGCASLSNFLGYWTERVLPPSVSRYSSLYAAQNNNVGGIRVREIKDYDPVTAVYNKIKYEYKLFSNPSLTSGMLVSSVRVLHTGGCSTRNCQYLRLSASSAYPLTMQNGSYVVYPEVRTIEENNGYSDRTFSFTFDVAPLAININDFPIVPQPDYSWLRGRLLAEKVYNNSAALISEKNTEGSETVTADIMQTSQIGHKVVGYYTSSSCPSPGTSGQVCTACMASYALFSQFSALGRTKDRTYNPDGSYIELLTEYAYYTNLGRTLLKEQRTYLSDGSIKKTTYRYAFNAVGDFVFGLTAPEQTMKATLLTKNYLEPLEITTTVTPSGGSASLVQGAKMAFNTFGTAIHLANVKMYGTSTSEFKETVLANYDSYGNLTEKYEVGGRPEVYLWGYKGTYPVAKIAGVNLSTVNPYFSQATLNAGGNDATFGSYLNTIRTNLASTTAEVTTFTYKPLVGITTTTDVKGMSTTYDYDKFMRLQNIKDRQLHIMKNYEYHYKP